MAMRLLAAAALAAGLCMAAGAAEAAESGSAGRCAALASVPIEGGRITSAKYTAPAGASQGYCEVAVTLGAQMDIALRLPDSWKQRYLQVGGGGFDGAIPPFDRPPASAVWSRRNPVDDGYVVAANNGGHRRADYPEAAFSSDPGMMLIYAGAKIYETDRVGRMLVERYYGAAPRYRYFAGCSNGGRNASIAAAYYSENYDGVIGGAGVWGVDGEAAISMVGHVAKWIQTGQTRPVIPKEKGAAGVAAQLAQCDALDGAKDGLISDPRACRFEARSLACKPGQTSGTCLTPAEVRTIETYRSPLKINGRAVGSAWGLADPSELAITTFPAAGHIALLRGAGKPNDPVGFDVQAEYPHLRDYLEGVWRMTGSIDAVTRYLAKGKKLIIHHGWDDPMVPPDNSIHAFEALSARAGKDAAAAQASLGKMRIRVDGTPTAGQPVLAQLMISHPNDSGLAMDQVTRTYATPHFVREVDVSYAGKPVMRADVDFSISENPNFRFYFVPTSADSGELKASVVDNQDLAFATNVRLDAVRSASASMAP
jgi:feruloyl esterase